MSKSLMLGSFVSPDRVSKQGKVSTRDGSSIPYRSSNSNLDNSPNRNISAFYLILQVRHGKEYHHPLQLISEIHPLSSPHMTYESRNCSYHNA